MGKPPELKTDEVTSERVKKVIEVVKRIAEGHIYVYQWNVHRKEASPLCLFVDPPKIEKNMRCSGADGINQNADQEWLQI